MRHRLGRPAGRLALAAVTAVALAGCATRGALKKAVLDQQTALAGERSERLAGDSALRTDVNGLRTDVQSLRTDLNALRTEFGAKIAAVEDGIRFAFPVNFAFDSATVREQDRAALERFARVVQKYYTGSVVTVEGFADPAGSTRYNLELSRRRADAVKSYLVAQGVSGDLLKPVGYGKTRLVAPGAWGEQPGAESNRRVVFVVETKATRDVAMTAPTGN